MGDIERAADDRPRGFYVFHTSTGIYGKDVTQQLPLMQPNETWEVCLIYMHTSADLPRIIPEKDKRSLAVNCSCVIPSSFAGRPQRILSSLFVSFSWTGIFTPVVSVYFPVDFQAARFPLKMELSSIMHENKIESDDLTVFLLHFRRKDM